MQRIVTIAIFIAVFAAGAAFSAVNNLPVNIQYYLGTVTMPISIVVIISLVMGITIGAFAIFIGSLQLRYENRRLQKKIDLREQELDSLRILPIKDTH
jgi:putative membrane protein|tara:strand:- start:2942 stop:3235 length:294 start_codon:yes stop_codon:yes gene_type:complete